MGEVRRSLSVWKFLGVLVLALVLVVGAFALWSRAVEERRWTAMKARTQELIRIAEARESRRPVLRGEPLPGDAADDYGLALVEIKKIGDNYVKISEFAMEIGNVDPAEIRALVKTHQAALDHMRRGTRREEVRFQVDWEGHFMTGAFNLQHLANLAACKAQFLSADGNPVEAAELLLDTARYGRDVTHNREAISAMLGVAIQWIAFDGLRKLLQSHRFSNDDLAQIGDELAILDRTFADPATTVLNEVACVGAKFGADKLDFLEDWETKEMVPMRHWKYAFSPRLMMTDTFTTMDRWGLQAAHYGSSSWPEEQAWHSSVEREGQNSDNPLILRMQDLGFPCSWTRVYRIHLAYLRLLRCAVGTLQDGEAPDLEDPFGDRIRHRKTPGSLTFWSVGRDGVDNDGKGTLKDASGNDIVLTIKERRE